MKINHIVMTMTKQKLLEKCRIRFLQEAWNYVVDQMCEALGKEKKHKKKLDKLKMLPDNYRDEYLSQYFKRAKLKFRLKVLL
jgi:hypothetical protein